MPDILLIDFIYYKKKHFQDIFKLLNVSAEALNIRLIEWLNYYSDAPKSYLETICLQYLTRTNEENIRLEIEKFKDYIETNYINLNIDPILQFSYYISKSNFVSNVQIPNLADIKIQNKIKQKFPNIKIWAYYNKGMTLWYAWNSNTITDKQAKEIAKIKLLLMTT
ncbi:hypothetical protein N1495_01375 [Streptococcus didelphis]|nr:hypothetical protein [Streptococcus didelphis]WMB29697.1 hypothetical protein N1495_01375 [Streptococcus didelphis]